MDFLFPLKNPNKFEYSFNCRPFSEEYESNADDRYAVNVVRLPGVTAISSICLPDKGNWLMSEMKFWDVIFIMLSFDLYTSEIMSWKMV